MPSSELSGVFFYVYLLRSCSKDSLYVGFTGDLRKRVKEHNNGLNRSTKFGAPWELIYYEAHTNESDARRREKYLKTTPGSRALKRMLQEYWMSMSDLNNQKVYY